MMVCCDGVFSRKHYVNKLFNVYNMNFLEIAKNPPECIRLNERVKHVRTANSTTILRPH